MEDSDEVRGDKIKLFTIAATVVSAVIISAFCLFNGITNVFPHVYYIPIILASYFYPRKGLLFTFFLGIVYLLEIVIFTIPTVSVIIPAYVRVVIFIIIAWVISHIALKKESFEKSLIENENRFMEIFNNINEGVAVFRPVDEGTDFEYFRLNKAGEKLEAFSNDEITGKTVTELSPEMTGSGLLEVMRKVWRSKEPANFLESKKCGGKAVSWRENYVYCLPSGEIVVVYSDITKKVQNEKILKENQSRFEIVLDSAQLGFWSFDLAEDAIYFDESYYRVHKINPVKYSGFDSLNKILDYIYAGDISKVEDFIRRLPEETRDVVAMNYRVEDEDKSIRWINFVCSIYERDSCGKPLKIAGIVHDISEMRKYQEGLVVANDKLNLLSSITRHDILNQVTALILICTLMEDQLSSEEELKESIHDIGKICNTIERQIKFTKEYHNLGVKMPLWQNLGEIIDRVANVATDSGIALSAHDCNICIFADPMIYKVFYNLFENSVRHGKSVSEISVSYVAAEYSPECTVIIEDDGGGIPDDNKGKIFTKGFGSNTGLGLFLTREILEITGIEISETGIFGAGSRFEITVPKNRWRIADSSREAVRADDIPDKIKDEIIIES